MTIWATLAAKINCLWPPSFSAVEIAESMKTAM